MAQFTAQIPDELEARVRSHADARGEDLSTFAARAFDEFLTQDEDPLLYAELLRKSRQSLDEIAAGRGIDARQAMRELANEKGLKFDR